MPQLFIHAANIHQGGGKSLLLAILAALPIMTSTVLLVDERMPLPATLGGHIRVRKIPPTILKRVAAEFWLRSNSRTEDTVLCFGNLPPLFNLLSRTIVFVQNRYLLDSVGLDGLPMRARMRLTIERIWLTMRISAATEFIVQTPTMKRLLNTLVKDKLPIRILPFVLNPIQSARKSPSDRKESARFDFLYVASGEPHKNHGALLQAWRELAFEGFRPTLCLTVGESQFPELYGEIQQICASDGLGITNLGGLPHDQVMALYENVGALIYPSNLESFGLPLIEARQKGLPILASELDYVRDILDPEQTFDPSSPTSIARAVKRFMGKKEAELVILSADQFIKSALNFPVKDSNLVS